jgi:carnitine 3-dehydrogenase
LDEGNAERSPDGLLSVRAVRTIGLLGMGSVGSGWAAIYLARGYDVLAHDPAPGAPERARLFLEATWPVLVQLGAASESPPLDRLRFGSLAKAASADLLHENAPEVLGVKQELYAAIEREAGESTIICSSSGGLKPSELQAGMREPSRLVVAHPFNPPHLVPLVEVLGGARTAPAVVDWTMRFMERLGKKPIRLEREMTAYLTNRLQFALLREAVHCVVEGVASPGAIDDALRYGLAPRWAAVGALMTLTLAGGPGGMPHVLDQFGDAIERWWGDLGQPTLTPEVRGKLVQAAAEITAGRPLPEWIERRDAKLVEILRVSKGLRLEGRRAAPRGPRKGGRTARKQNHGPRTPGSARRTGSGSQSSCWPRTVSMRCASTNSRAGSASPRAVSTGISPTGTRCWTPCSKRGDFA